MTKYFSVFLFIALLIPSCSVKYGFTGASISPDVKTVSIQAFQYMAPYTNPTFATSFTQALKDKFTNQTSLSLTRGIGDLNFEGEITDYSIRPQAATANETSALNQLTVTVRVKFTNAIDPKLSFDTKFTRDAKYTSSQNFEEVQSGLVEQIIGELIEDIFNKAVVNW